MPKLIDLTGQKIGRWTVLMRAPNRNRSVYWLCQCDCGTIREVKSGGLLQKTSLSCGCLQKEKSKVFMQEHGSEYCKKNDLIGQQFGDWTVLYDSNKRRDNGSIIWHCKCICGTEKDIETRYLKDGISTNCGCKSKKISKGEDKIINILKENNINFETQKTFLECRFKDTNQLAKFDFYLPDYNLLIEYDGEQHFTYSNEGWNTQEKFIKTQEHDNFKNQWCKDNNIPLIRIPYTHYNNLCLEDLLLETSDFLI